MGVVGKEFFDVNPWVTGLSISCTGPASLTLGLDWYSSTHQALLHITSVQF